MARHGQVFDLKPHTKDSAGDSVVVSDGYVIVSLIRTADRKVKVHIEADETVRWRLLKGGVCQAET